MFNEKEVIYSYTREQAIADGVLVDVSEMAKEAGFLYPVAVTQGVWHDIVVPSPRDQKDGQSIDGRLWDVLYMLKCAIHFKTAPSNKTDFFVIAVHERKQETHKLYALCGPGDNAEPVVTIMHPWED